MKNIKKLCLNILHDKVLSPILFVAFGMFFGVIAINLGDLSASLVQVSEKTQLSESEVMQAFTDVENMREVAILPLSETTFLVEFLATDGQGDSLHPFQYIVTKNGKTLVEIKEFFTPEPASDASVITEPVDVQVQ